MRYPYIYSISTVNLIYHGSCDYKLNPLCTGFAGESGVGKSIIADLLQLIFVGEGPYESATKGKGSRPLHKLVQKRGQVDEGNSRGYVFANIQTGSGEFLIIGCALESLSQQCVPFVIQQGEDFRSQLRSINRPLSHTTFIDNNSIIAVTELREHLYRTQQVMAKVFVQRPSEYYKILLDNDLVPINICKPTLLKDYAKILRSFSRSGELDKNPDNLESFLFGSEAKERIWASYEQLLASAGRDKRDYDENVRRILRIERKISGFRQLTELLTEARSLRRAYQNNEVRVARQNREAAESETKHLLAQIQSIQLLTFRLAEAQARRSLRDSSSLAIINRCNKRRLRELPSFIINAKEAMQVADTHRKNAEEIVRIAKENLNKANQVEIWLSSLGPKYEDLLIALEKKQTSEHQSKLRNNLWAYLQEQKQADYIRLLGWHNGRSALQVQQEEEEWRQTAADARRLASYTDLTNSNSLTNWALMRNESLTPEQESVLAHFGQLDKWRNQEERQARFLETADSLINDEMVIEAGESSDGFWLCLSGIKEWIIRLLPEQRLFGEVDKDQVRGLLARWNQKNENQAKELEDKSQVANTLLNVLKGSSRWEEALPLLNDSNINTILLPSDFPNNSVDLDSAIDLHRKRNGLIVDREKALENENLANIEYNSAVIALSNLENEQSTLQRQSNEIDRAKLAADLWKFRREMRNIRQETKDWLMANSDSLPVEIINEHHIEADKVDNLPTGELNRQIITAEIKLKAGQKELTSIELKLIDLQKVENEAQAKFNKLPTIEYHELETIPTLSDVQAKENTYELLFRELVKELLSSDEVNKYQPFDDLLYFMQEVLPDGVRGVIRSTDEGQERLQNALSSINESMREIARLKLVELGQLIGQVREAYDGFAKEIGDLQKYFRREKTEITGGFRPYIATRPVTTYPVEWVDEFQRTAAEPEIVRQLANLDSIENILYRAYTQKGGTDSKWTISKLLDPLSYLKLEFEMKNDDGHINDGSSGQTFMAAALLNIARLSVIGRSGGPHTAQRGLRFMAIDEVDSLGSNYATLLELAHKENFQVISLSVRPLVYETGTEQRLYFLHLGRNRALRQNLPPVMLSKGELAPISTERFAPLPNPTLFDPLLPDAAT